MGNQDMKELYKKAGMDRRVGFGKRPGILVVDFIIGFTTKDGSPFGSDYLDDNIKATRELLDAAREKDIPIVFSTEIYSSNMKDCAIWYSKMPGLKNLQPDTRAVEVDERLGFDPEKEVLLPKKTASPFFGTNLASIYIAQRVDTLLVAGCTTSGCVRAAVHDACAYGFRTNIVSECVADCVAGPHEANMFDMDGKYGDVISLEEALLYLKNL